MKPLERAALGTFAPLQGGITHPLQSVAHLLDALQRLAALQEENQRQSQLIARLSGEIVRLRELEIENQQLREQLGYQIDNPERALLPASVIGRDPSNLVQSIIIDKGSAQGVEEGMVVIESAGLVGKVIGVSPTSAKVLLITDPRSSVTAMIQRPNSRAVGVVSGQPGNRLIMRYLPQSEEVRQTDLVVTSGLGGGFPKGLLIGKVVEVRQKDIEMFQGALVETAVPFAKLESVLVVLDFTPDKWD